MPLPRTTPPNASVGFGQVPYLVEEFPLTVSWFANEIAEDYQVDLVLTTLTQSEHTIIKVVLYIDMKITNTMSFNPDTSIDPGSYTFKLINHTNIEQVLAISNSFYIFIGGGSASTNLTGPQKTSGLGGVLPLSSIPTQSPPGKSIDGKYHMVFGLSIASITLSIIVLAILLLRPILKWCRHENQSPLPFTSRSPRRSTVTTKTSSGSLNDSVSAGATPRHLTPLCHGGSPNTPTHRHIEQNGSPRIPAVAGFPGQPESQYTVTCSCSSVLSDTGDHLNYSLTSPASPSAPPGYSFQ